MLCLTLTDISIISIKNVDYCCIFMILVNLKQFIFFKVLHFMIVGIYKTDVNIKDKTCNYFSNLIDQKKLGTKNVLIDEKNFLRMW